MAHNDKKFEDEELLDLLELEYPITLTEMAKRLGVCLNTVRERIQKLIKKGRIIDRNKERVSRNVSWYTQLMERNLEKGDTGAGKVLLEMARAYIPASKVNIPIDVNDKSGVTFNIIKSYNDKKSNSDNNNSDGS